METHDPGAFASELASKLATKTRHVNIFLGAGSSRACGLPDVAGLQEHVLTNLSEDERKTFEALLENRNLEQALSRLRRIAALVEDQDTVNGLNAEAATKLDERICELIAGRLSVEGTDLDPVVRFAHWVARAEYSRPVEIFTVNYDLLVESALDSLAIPYFDGFVGTLTARFRSDLVDAPPSSTEGVPVTAARVWKLHGSLNWGWRRETTISEVVRFGYISRDLPVAIFPSDTKYEESRRVPFVVLQDRLRRALNEPESLTLVSGYSWGDEHLNEMFIDAAIRRPRSETVVLCYGALPERLSARAESIPNLQVVGRTEATIGGLRASWETANEVPDIWYDGQFRLGDFSSLSRFLARASPDHATDGATSDGE